MWNKVSSFTSCALGAIFFVVTPVSTDACVALPNCIPKLEDAEAAFSDDSCDTFTSNLDNLVKIATSEMKARTGELRLLGLLEDGSDLIVVGNRATQRSPVPEREVDHPMDRATVFLYATIHEFDYRFAFSRCGETLEISNLSGFKNILGGDESK